MKAIAFIFLLIVFGPSTIAQVSPKKVSSIGTKTVQDKFEPCQLSMSDAPALRGFRLHDDLIRLTAKIPRLRNVYIESITEGLFSKFGLANIEGYKIFPVGEPLPSDFSELKDVEFNLHFFDESVSYIGISYEEYEPDSLREFIQQVTVTTTLKENGWKISDKFHASMDCKDFTATLWTGRVVERSFYQAYPTFTLSDKLADQELKRRIQAAKNKEIQDELDRKKEAEEKARLEREKKKVFKP